MTSPFTRATAVLAALSALLLLALPFGAPQPADAAVSRVYVESVVIEPGGEATLSIVAEATPPGIGAWGMDLVYDGDLVALQHCESAVGLCSPSFPGYDYASRIVGASVGGLNGTVILATYAFVAGNEKGEAELDVIINQLTDPSGQDITVTAEDGSITIAEATPTPSPSPTPSPTPVPTAVPTATPAVVPAAGGPPSPSATPIALLAATGAVIAVAGAWILRRIRQP